MGILDSYLTLKNRVSINDAIMTGVAKAISEQAEIEFKRLFCASSDIDNSTQNTLTQTEVKRISSPIVDDLPLPKDTGQKRDFDSVMDLIEETDRLSNNSSYLAVKECISAFFDKNMSEEKLKSVKEELNITTDDEKFYAIFFFWLYFVVHSFFSSKPESKELEYGIKALDHYVMSLNQNFGLWLEKAKSRNSLSPILTNPNSREILKYLYENLEYDSKILEQQLIIKLTHLRYEIINSLSEIIEKNEEINNIRMEIAYKKEVEKKEDEKNNYYVTVITTLLFLLILLITVISVFCAK